MLKLKYLFENYDLARACLALYDHDEATLDEMLAEFRISSNAIYPFRSGTNPEEVRFLRLSPVEEKPFEWVASEIKLIHWLIARGYSAMRPVPMKDGREACVIDTQWGRYNVSCFARVPGEALDDLPYEIRTHDVVRGYGASLGALHNALSEYPCAEERRDHNALLDEIGQRLSAYGAPSLMRREYEKVKTLLGALPIRGDNYGVVHFDFEVDNVFYDAGTGVYSAIDFDDAMRGWFSLDIVRALDTLDDMLEEEDLTEASAAFLEGYRSVRPLSEADEYTLPLMRRFVLLRKYSTLLHVMSERIDVQPEWLVALSEKLTGRLRWVEAQVRERER